MIVDYWGTAGIFWNCLKKEGEKEGWWWLGMSGQKQYFSFTIQYNNIG